MEWVAGSPPPSGRLSRDSRKHRFALRRAVTLSARVVRSCRPPQVHAAGTGSLAGIFGAAGTRRGHAARQEAGTDLSVDQRLRSARPMAVADGVRAHGSGRDGHHGHHGRSELAVTGRDVVIDGQCVEGVLEDG